MEEYYNPTLKEYVNAVLDGQDIYYIIDNTMSGSPSKEVEYGIMDMSYPYNFSDKDKHFELYYVLYKNNVTIEEFTRFNNLLKFLEVQNEFVTLKPHVRNELKAKDRDIVEEDLDHFYLPELRMLYLKR